MNNQLHACLERFRELANDNPRVLRLIEGWQPLIRIAPNDEATAYAARVDGAIDPWRTITTEVTATDAETPDDTRQITLCASAAVLAQVFSGDLNPARAHLDGTLQVFADDRDQVKLDAISLILWGV